MPKRNHFISQLAHVVEIFSPKPEESVKFFKGVLGLEESGRIGQSVYLRAWGEFFHHSLKVTEAKTNGLGHIGWRAESDEDLLDAVEYINSTGSGKGWIDGDLGHGKDFQFYHLMGIWKKSFGMLNWPRYLIIRKVNGDPARKRTQAAELLLDV
ncbi:VOC family protein [Neobacillus cucumis]|uniref:VOC family protein n=1 Tax=Neobacillus cucumis TaxID=1740721 RepID=UPI00196408BD|nr:VOC family protein [Neobacillus cucumis]MBM7652413.1 catechol 2,3-dioxygenase-like lactoylglutathione lyase family enzyme [Neobacillus cucumis]